MASLSPRALARIEQLTAPKRAVEFGPLGSAVKWRKPLTGTAPLPPGTAAYVPPAGVRLGKGTDKVARRAGAVLVSQTEMPGVLAKASGYRDGKSLTNALRRHEIVHSIQAAKRGYRIPTKIREVVKDEIGAYATMNRGVKGGSKLLRAANAATGVPISVAAGVAANPRLRKRAAAYGAGAAALAGGALAVKKLREDRKDMGAETREVLALAERLRRKLVAFAALPRRDPTTGTFTAGGTVTAKALRRAWAAPVRIAPRAQSNAARSLLPAI